jgi:hypothetical protein
VRPPVGSMIIQRVDRAFAPQTLTLLDELRLSLFGIRTRRLHAALVEDGISGDIDCRIATEDGRVKGVVLAAPASYWRTAPLKHWGVAIDCVRARLGFAAHDAAIDRASSIAPETASALCERAPARTWADPGDAWRIILVGTGVAARGQGVAAHLYRSLMAERSLVARIAVDNTPSIRLHRSLGWALYRDGAVALAVHERGRQAACGGIAAGCRPTP